MDYGQIKLYLYASYLLSTIRVIEYCVEKCKLKSSFNKFQMDLLSTSLKSPNVLLVSL